MENWAFCLLCPECYLGFVFEGEGEEEEEYIVDGVDSRIPFYATEAGELEW